MLRPKLSLDRLAAFLLPAGAALLYLPALAYPFVSFDDPDYVIRNALLDAPLTEAVARAFREPFYGAYQPLTLVALRLIAAVAGRTPAAYHAALLILYAGGCGLVLAVLRRLVDAPRATAVAAVLFALHPVHAEAAVWVSALKEALYFVLATGAVLAAASSGRTAIRTAAATGLGALAMLAKGSAMVLPLLIAGVGLAQRRPRSTWVPAAGILAAAAVPVAALNLRVHTAQVLERTGAPFFDLAQGLGALATLAAHAAFPVGLAAAYDPPSGTQVALGVALVGAMAAGAIALRDRRPLAALGVAWFAVALLPVAGFVPLTFPAADRYLLVPTVGLAIALADLLRGVPARRHLWAAPAAIAFAALAVVRARQYRSDEALWEAAVAAAPNHADARANLGAAYVELKRYGDAERQLVEQIRISPDKKRPWRDLFLLRLVQTPSVSVEQMNAFAARYEEFAASPDVVRGTVLAGQLRRAGAIAAAVQVEAEDRKSVV